MQILKKCLYLHKEKSHIRVLKKSYYEIQFVVIQIF